MEDDIEVVEAVTSEEHLQVDYALAGKEEIKETGPVTKESYFAAIEKVKAACIAVPRDGTPTSQKAWYAFDLFLDFVQGYEEQNQALKSEIIKMDQIIKNQNITLQKAYQANVKKSSIVGATEADLKKVLSEG